MTIPEKAIVELRRRIEAARWPTKELVADRSQGVQIATLKPWPPTGRPTMTGGRPKPS